MWVTVRPIAANTGCARANTSGSPPAMIDSVPAIAPCSPPDTGASRKPTPAAAQRAASVRAVSGAIVLVSITTRPRAAPVRTPSGPVTTSSTSGPSGRQVTTASAAAATAAGVSAARAPSSTRGSTRARRLPWTTTSWPALSRLRAMGAPMMPRPITPTRMSAGISEPDLGVELQADQRRVRGAGGSRQVVHEERLRGERQRIEQLVVHGDDGTLHVRPTETEVAPVERRHDCLLLQVLVQRRCRPIAAHLGLAELD